MGTTWTAKFVQPTTPLPTEVVRARLAARLEALEQIFSTYRPHSEISRFNSATTTAWISVPPELADVAAASRRISELTGGAFDPTVAPLLRLWGFGPAARSGEVPNDDALTAVRRRVGWRQLETQTNPPALRKTAPAVAVDFSSTAKGFSADQLSELLTALGAPRHFIQIGGDIRTSGHASDDSPWRAGIEEPREAATTVAQIVLLRGEALSTSGNDRNFVEIAGRRYGHIVDPRTGHPVDGPLAAVSVVSADCATSSALATALFVLGPDAGFALAEREGIAALFLVRADSGRQTRPTTAFAKFIPPLGRTDSP